MPDSDLLESVLADPFAAVADYYASCLTAHPRAVEFVLEDLGLTAEQAAAQRIGFADRSLGTHLPHKRIKAGREVRQLLVQAGLYKQNGRETLRGYVTVPINDDAGQTIGIRGYKLDPHTSGPAELVVQQEGERPKEGGRLETGGGRSEEPTRESAPEPSGLQPSASDLSIADGQLTFIRDDRRYRVRGLEKNTSTCQLKVNLMASRDGLVHLDSLDLVKARSRASFIKAAATELYVDEDIIKKDVGQLLLRLETLQTERIDQLKQPTRAEIKLSEGEQAEALELLRDPNLLSRILTDLDACGMVGERTNKLAGYLAAVSRKLDTPLAIVIQSSSSAGKTSLMDAILAMVPDEDQLRLTGLSGQSLYYLEGGSLRHKILAISEDEGISEAAYALKLLQSEGVLRHATVSKGEHGRMTTQHYTVEGPVGLFLTTTAVDLDEELMNRCLVLSVDESREQTRAIQSRQRDARTLAARQAATAALKLRTLHQNAQRLIEPLAVCNPYAPQLTFASEKTRLRRDHNKYLTLIEAIALLHQHQRQIHTAEVQGETLRYVNVTAGDIAVANGLAGELLGRSLDELSPQTRTFLIELHHFVSRAATEQQLSRSAVRFTRRDVRQATGWSDFQSRTHLAKLVELEYLLVHRGKNGRRYVYELLYDGQGREGQPFLTGLIDPAKLATPSAPTTPTLSIPQATLSTDEATLSLACGRLVPCFYHRKIAANSFTDNDLPALATHRMPKTATGLTHQWRIGPVLGATRRPNAADLSRALSARSL